MYPKKSGVPMDTPPAGQKSLKSHGFQCSCLRRVKNLKKSGVMMDVP